MKEDTCNTAENEKEVLKRFAEDWDRCNLNLKIIGAYIHVDEPDGTVHMYLDYIPVATTGIYIRPHKQLGKIVNVKHL